MTTKNDVLDALNERADLATRSEWTQEEWDAYWAEYDRALEAERVANEKWQAEYDELVAANEKAEADVDRAEKWWRFALWAEYTAYHLLGLTMIAIAVGIHPWVAAVAVVVYASGFGWLLMRAVWAALFGK